MQLFHKYFLFITFCYFKKQVSDKLRISSKEVLLVTHFFLFYLPKNHQKLVFWNNKMLLSANLRAMIAPIGFLNILNNNSWPDIWFSRYGT